MTAGRRCTRSSSDPHERLPLRPRRRLPFSPRNPLYYLFHESSYADGFATRWSADRVEPDDFRADATLLTGEHARRDWLDTVPGLAPWRGAALMLAEVEWPRLYDADALASSGARGAAAVYVNDVFVPVEFSLETSRLLPGSRPGSRASTSTTACARATCCRASSTYARTGAACADLPRAAPKAVSRPNNPASRARGGCVVAGAPVCPGDAGEACSTCWPQPVQVALPQVRQVIF
jgi:hypothetical protein